MSLGEVWKQYSRFCESSWAARRVMRDVHFETGYQELFVGVRWLSMVLRKFFFDIPRHHLLRNFSAARA